MRSDIKDGDYGRVRITACPTMNYYTAEHIKTGRTVRIIILPQQPDGSWRWGYYTPSKRRQSPDCATVYEIAQHIARDYFKDDAPL